MKAPLQVREGQEQGRKALPRARFPSARGRRKVFRMSNVVSRTVVMLAVAATVFGQAQTSCDTSGPHTLYSEHASTIEQGDIKSPDGRKVLSVARVPDMSGRTEGRLKFSVTDSGRRHWAELAGFAAEVTWSPDSSAFAVTQTEGGGGIGYRVYVFYVEATGLRKLTVSTPIEKAFGTPTKCEVPVRPNTGFVMWLAGSERVLVAAEVVPVSICECSGLFSLYEVHVPDLRIVNYFDQSATKKKFANVLGCELRNAKNCSTTKLRRR
jgi:hypothetical protein